MTTKRTVWMMIAFAISICSITVPAFGDVSPPATPVKLIFIHHSCGGNWLADETPDIPSGGLGTALMNNNYYVSATNYDWGPDGIGNRTNIPDWPEWFTGPNSGTILAALYAETGQNLGGFGAWSRMATEPGGENEIIMFKSCFPNSDLYGNPDDPPRSSPNEQYTVENAKVIYNDLLTYFETRTDKMFIVITAPPLIESETTSDRAANARAFNNWMVRDWLDDYPHNNVAVFDYFNVLTDPANHHRIVNGQIEHVVGGGSNFAYYPAGDSHPNSTGHRKATEEFIPLLNYYYNQWQSGSTGPTDRDGDGTPDSEDGCPDDPGKIAPGVCGCGVSDADSDGDGTADCNDECPNDPNKTTPGQCGCGVDEGTCLPTDSDGDGTPDSEDGCPDDPLKIDPGECGCGVAEGTCTPADADGDGTPNSEDGCPYDPTKIAPGTCGCGVSDVDSDGDGTEDCIDGCPNDPDKTSPGECGCGVAEGTCTAADSDGDGTPDNEDGCPDDPNKTAPGECGCGEADTDSDGDGVPDCIDSFDGDGGGGAGCFIRSLFGE